MEPRPGHDPASLAPGESETEHPEQILHCRPESLLGLKGRGSTSVAGLPPTPAGQPVGDPLHGPEDGWKR